MSTLCAHCREELPALPSADVVQHPVEDWDGDLDYIELAHRRCAPEWGVFDNWGKERSPDALLPGYEKCYVAGCWENAVVSAQHKRFGLVIACSCHNPGNHGMAKPFSVLPVVEAPVLSEAEAALAEVDQMTPEQQIAELLREVVRLALRPPQPPDPEGGLGAKLKPTKPILPSGTVGLQVPH